jgi:hypothetical protein
VGEREKRLVAVSFSKRKKRIRNEIIDIFLLHIKVGRKHSVVR